jgi:hypothetical protein
LRALEHEKLEVPRIVVDRDAPFLVVIAAVSLLGNSLGPGATN